MFFLREPIVKATIRLLQLYGVRVNESMVNETLQNHPAWPSLLSVSDALSEWKVPNAAGKATPEELDTIPTPFMAVNHDRISQQAVVSQIRETEVDIYKSDFRRIETLTKDDFLKIWKGIFLIVEPDKNSGEHKYEINKQKYTAEIIIPIVLGLLLLSLGFLLIRSRVNTSLLSLNTLSLYFQYFIYVVGFIISGMLVWYEIDKSNPVLKKICSGLTKTNCDAVLNSKQSKLFNTVSWGEVGLFYYAGSLMTLIFAPISLVSLQFLSWLGIMAVPYTIFSIYYQWKVVREWCTLCLSIQALLMMNALNILFSSIPLLPIDFIVSSFLIIAALYLIVPILWYILKPLAFKIQKSTTTTREYNRLKFNTEIFETLLHKQKMITEPIDDLGIDIGNKEAKNTIVKVCNPYCGPCAKAHPQIEELIEQNKDIKAKIIFTTKNEETQPAYHPTRHLLAIAEKNEESITKRALDDWYLADTKEYAQFSNKYPMNGELERQGEKMEKMESWCTKMEISHTPTLFINGFQLPDAYGIEDLKYFLLD